MIPHIDWAKRKQLHTREAVLKALRLNITPIILEIHYPSLVTVPASYYRIVCGGLTPITKADAHKPGYIALWLIYLPSKELVYQWK